MDITVNHQHYQFHAPCSVEQLLSQVHAPAKGIAVAVNQTIIAKADWALHILKQGDQVMLIKATQGG